MTLYLVRDGINGVGCVTVNGKQVIGTDFYLITYDFKSNEGYVEKKGEKNWRLYTQVGQKLGRDRYHSCFQFDECVEKLIVLNENNEVIVCSSTDIDSLLVNRIKKG